MKFSKDLETRRKDINQLVHDEVYEYSGSFSAEHGIGQLKLDELTTRKSFIEMENMDFGGIRTHKTSHRLLSRDKNLTFEINL